MSSLLSRAKVKRENAENSYKKISTDDAYLDDCCYNLQQCIEFTLKFIVEENGESYVENHDIRAQLNKLKSLGLDVPERDSLRQIASTLNSWEAESRYSNNFLADIEDIDESRRIADALINFAESLICETDPSMDAFPESRIKP